MADIIRQGDVVLTRVTTRPGALSSRLLGRSLRHTPARRVSPVLAIGEATGHSHRIAGGVVVDLGEGPTVASTGRTVLEHEEHRHIRIPRGLWRVSMQREWTPQSTRLVVD